MLKPKQLHHVVSGPATVAEEIFNSAFIAAWLTTPVLTPENPDHADEFGLFLAGGPL